MKKSKFRIAFIHNMYISYRIPVFENLSKRYDVTFFFEQIGKGVKNSSRYVKYQLMKSLGFYGKYRWSPELFFLLFKGRFDLYILNGVGHLNSLIGFIVGFILRKPMLLWEVTWYRPLTLPRALIWPLSKSMIKKVDAICVCGVKAKDFFVSHGVAPQKILFAPNAISLEIPGDEKVLVDELRRSLGCQGKKVILFFGRLLKIKGINYLIEAFAKLEKDKYFLVIASSSKGPEYEALSKSCERLRLKNVSFITNAKEDERVLYFLLADVVVLPSVFYGADAEVWGLVVNEALSVGKPVIATHAVGAAYDLIENGINGYIVPDKDPNTLLKAIKKILTKSSARTKIKQLRSDEYFNFEYTVEGLVDGIEKAIHKHNARAMYRDNTTRLPSEVKGIVAAHA